MFLSVPVITGLLAAAFILLFFWVQATWAKWVFGLLSAYGVLNVLGGIADFVGVKISVAQIRPAIEHIMFRGHHRARIRFKQVGSRRAVDFIKLCPIRATTRFFMRVDRWRCSDKEFEAAKQVLSNQEISFQTEQNRRDQLRFLIVECGQDSEKAVTAARAILTQAFGLPYDATLRYMVYGGFTLRWTAVIGWDREVDKRAAGERATAEAIGSLEVGTKGKIISAGRAEFDDKEFDVVCRGGFADPGTEVEIVEIDGDRIVVQKVDAEEDNKETD